MYKTASQIVDEAFEKNAGAVQNYLGNLTGKNLNNTKKVFSAAEKKYNNFYKGKGGIGDFAYHAKNLNNANNALIKTRKATTNTRVATGVGLTGAGLYAHNKKEQSPDVTGDNAYPFYRY